LGSEIARLGFRKWYERRLIEAHAWLVTALLCAILVALSVEVLATERSISGWLGTAGVVFFAGLIVWHGTRRFLELLAQAEHLAQQSTCESCRRYGLFNVIAENPRMSVRCRKCGHEWTFN
jgi:protein-S-isoprenylcysteine O-methyltransferase Ste14